MSKKISSRLTAVAFAAALTLAGTAEAGPLFAGAAGPEASSWSQAWEWLNRAWGDLTSLVGTTAQPSKPGGNSTNDAGCGIDPNGACGGG